MVDEDSRIQSCNPASLSDARLSARQGHRPAARHAAARTAARRPSSAASRTIWRRASAGSTGARSRSSRCHRDGHEFPVEISFSDMQIGGHRIFGAFIRDISQRVQQQQALQRSEERYRRIVQTAEEGIWMIDAATVTTFVNPKMASMLGYTAQEMLGHNLFEFMDERAAEQAHENVRRREQGIAEQHDFRLRRKDGSAVWTAMSTSAALRRAAARLRRCARDGHRHHRAPRRRRGLAPQRGALSIAVGAVGGLVLGARRGVPAHQGGGRAGLRRQRWAAPHHRPAPVGGGERGDGSRRPGTRPSRAARGARTLPRLRDHAPGSGRRAAHGQRQRRAGVRRGEPLHRLPRRRPRHHGTAPRPDPASRPGGAAARGAEDGGHRRARRRHRA